MVLKPVLEDDLESLRELQPDGWPDIVPVFKFYIDSPFCFPVKISGENSVSGIGAGIRFGSTGWLAHIIVRSEQRNKGIGGPIVDHLVSKLREEGCESISLIATELGHPVYKKFGFVDQTDYVFYQKQEPSSNQYLSRQVVRCSEEWFEEILCLDHVVSGETRRELLIDKLQGSFVYRRNGGLTGFYLPDLGEGLIVAEDPEAGVELMKARLTGANRGILPVDNRAATGFLTANGFSEYRRGKRMVWGKAFPWQPDKLYNRIGGNLG